MAEPTYIHGTDRVEQERLTLLNRLTNSAFIQFLELQPDSRVLEVGSGLGILAREVAERLPSGHVLGIEYALQQLAAGKAGARNVHFVQGDAHSLPFENDCFDVAYGRYLLEHVADPVRVLHEMHRVLKPGGKAFVQENNILVNCFDPEAPSFDAVWKQFAILQRRLGGDALIGKRLFALFKRAGFREITLSVQPEVHHAGDPTFQPWVENIIGNVQGAAARLQAEDLATRDEIDAAVAELRALIARDDATALFYWNRAVGVK